MSILNFWGINTKTTPAKWIIFHALYRKHIQFRIAAFQIKYSTICSLHSPAMHSQSCIFTSKCLCDTKGPFDSKFHESVDCDYMNSPTFRRAKFVAHTYRQQHANNSNGDCWCCKLKTFLSPSCNRRAHTQAISKI